MGGEQVEGAQQFTGIQFIQKIGLHVEVMVPDYSVVKFTTLPQFLT